MSLVSGLVYHEKSILVCEFQVSVYRRVMRRSDRIESELLEDLDVFSDDFLSHYMSQAWMLHM